MATTAFFSDQADGSVVAFRNTSKRVALNNGTFRTHIVPAKVWKGDDGKLYGFNDNGKFLITRKIEMKSFPSRHDCDARCYNATGRTMNCECACGGVNHGKGSFSCVEA
jgi:hypothetical protein